MDFCEQTALPTSLNLEYDDDSLTNHVAIWYGICCIIGPTVHLIFYHWNQPFRARKCSFSAEDIIFYSSSSATAVLAQSSQSVHKVAVKGEVKIHSACNSSTCCCTSDKSLFTCKATACSVFIYMWMSLFLSLGFWFLLFLIILMTLSREKVNALSLIVLRFDFFLNQSE